MKRHPPEAPAIFAQLIHYALPAINGLHQPSIHLHLDCSLWRKGFYYSIIKSCAGILSVETRPSKEGRNKYFPTQSLGLQGSRTHLRLLLHKYLWPKTERREVTSVHPLSRALSSEQSALPHISGKWTDWRSSRQMRPQADARFELEDWPSERLSSPLHVWVRMRFVTHPHPRLTKWKSNKPEEIKRRTNREMRHKGRRENKRFKECAEIVRAANIAGEPRSCSTLRTGLSTLSRDLRRPLGER